MNVERLPLARRQPLLRTPRKIQIYVPIDPQDSFVVARSSVEP